MKKKEKALEIKSNRTNKKISSKVRSELPAMHEKYLKKFKGNHNFINKFIYVPDLIGGGDADDVEGRNKNTYAVGQYLSSGEIQYDLIGFSLDKSMHLKFQYIFQDKESGLSSVAWLIEAAEGWKVSKIEEYV